MWRTVDECLRLIKQADEGTAITLYRLREIAKSGAVKTMQSGKKLLISYVSLCNYLAA